MAKTPEFVPNGYSFDAGGNRLKRKSDAAGAEFLYPEDHPGGTATVVYHPTRHVNGHFDAEWKFVPHGVPEGFRFLEGRLVVKDAEAVPEQIVGTKDQPASIPLPGPVEGKE